MLGHPTWCHWLLYSACKERKGNDYLLLPRCAAKTSTVIRSFGIEIIQMNWGYYPPLTWPISYCLVGYCIVVIQRYRVGSIITGMIIILKRVIIGLQWKQLAWISRQSININYHFPFLSRFTAFCILQAFPGSRHERCHLHWQQEATMGYSNYRIILPPLPAAIPHISAMDAVKPRRSDLW